MQVAELRTHFFYWSLALFALTLPMPKYSINSQAFILLVVSWLTLNPFREKKRLFIENKKSVLLLVSLYVLLVIGMIYTKNLASGLENLKDKIPLLVTPIIFSTLPRSVFKQKLKLFRLFSIAVVLAALFALAKACYISYEGMGDYFVYDKFSLLLNRHTTYYSLFCVVAICYFLNHLFKQKNFLKPIDLLCISFLVFVIYLLSSRIALIALMLVAVFYLNFYFFKLKQKLTLTICVALAVFAVLFFSSNYTRRLQTVSENPKLQTFQNELNIRALHWQSALKTLNGVDFLIGKGTGDGKEHLFKQYKKDNFEAGFQHHYNAHNQYLEFLLSNGAIGVLAYLSILTLVLVYAIRLDDRLGIINILLLSLFSITESILERQSGIMLFSLLINLTFFTNKYALNRNNLYIIGKT